MDSSQKEVLLGHWRCDKPNSITAFAEETKEMFPVDEDTEKFLQVPSLDDLIGRCLIKKHGNKAAFSKTGKSLFTQPYKMLEKIAYRGQQASYMGIIINMYMQQSLGTLIELFNDDKPNIDNARKHIRDIFAMSTKSLDQLGRAGAFHHIVRRQLSMTDTSLFQLEDSRDLSDLPLSAEGVFGDKLETTLKSRKEKNKTLEDLLPEFPKYDKKRKANFSTNTNVKRSCLEKDKGSSVKEDFRIPRISHNKGFRKSSDKTQAPEGERQGKTEGFYKKPPFPVRGGRAFNKR
ncbi:hypothetical protein SNE40_016792 [Patella caerulea]